MKMRRTLKLAAAAPILFLAAACSRPAEAAGPEITVYKTPTCGCCNNWVDHLRAEGFQVKTENMSLPQLATVRTQHDVPEELGSCHTGVIEGYAVEGHVPADVIRRLLAERPEVAGIAVPGMPMGSPGMEGPYSQPYEVYTFDANGPVDVYEAR